MCVKYVTAKELTNDQIECNQFWKFNTLQAISAISHIKIQEILIIDFVSIEKTSNSNFCTQY